MILVTGGTGYIGSHTVVELATSGHNLLILDNLSNSNLRVVDRLAAISGCRPRLIVGDIRDETLMTQIFAQNSIDAVIHFAGLKAVGESVENPLAYYDNNVNGTLKLLATMHAAGVYNLVFSSSATVYGDPQTLPINENSLLQATNPYGRTKLHIEEILRDLAAADSRWQIVILRYFNPVGAHPSGLIGEDPRGLPNNLMPYVAQVAVGRRAELSVFGNDYPTADGTGVRDYIHVVDLARGHLAALKCLAPGARSINLGTGRGHSVLEVIDAFEMASGRTVPYRFSPRRPGDVAACWADPSLAKTALGWQAEHTLAEMCADHWRWQRDNPNGLDS